MVQGILTARLLGVADFGILGIIIMFTSVINKFVSFRMGELVIKYVGEYSESADNAHAAAIYKSAGLAELTASVLAYVLIWVLAPLAALLFAKNPALAGWFRLYGLIVIANLIAESSTGLLQVFDRYRQIAVMGVVQSIVTLALIALVFVEGGGMVGVLLAYLLGKTVGALGLTGAALLEAGRHWGKRWWSTSLALLQARGRELSHFAITTNISATLSLVNKDSELLWVSLFTNPQQTGYYRLALSLVNMVQLPGQPAAPGDLSGAFPRRRQRRLDQLPFYLAPGFNPGGHLYPAGLSFSPDLRPTLDPYSLYAPIFTGISGPHYSACRLSGSQYLLLEPDCTAGFRATGLSDES